MKVTGSENVPHNRRNIIRILGFCSKYLSRPSGFPKYQGAGEHGPEPQGPISDFKGPKLNWKIIISVNIGLDVGYEVNMCKETYKFHWPPEMTLH